MPSLPYSEKKRYLSGVDWIIGALNDYMVSTGAAGNHSSLIFTLDSRLPSEALRARIAKVFEKLPQLHGESKRDFANLAPFWRPGASADEAEFPFETLSADSDAELDVILRKTLNRPFRGGNEHLAFFQIGRGDNDILVMTFDHRILDARGAETFSRLLSEDGLKSADGVKTTAAPELRNWAAKFAAGRDVQRKIIKMTKTAGCHAFMDGRVGGMIERPLLNSVFRTFSADETRGIEAASERSAGFMMETVHLLAATALAFHKNSSPRDGKWFFVPVPIDMRERGGDPFENLLFNHFSFLFFHFEVTPESSLDSLAREIRGQLLAQVAEEFPEKMVAASRLGRIFPFWLIRRFMGLPFDGKMASFVFANVGESSAAENLMGVKVKSITHMPRIPSPPGVGVFFSRYGRKLNLTVTADEANLGAEFARATAGKISDLLLQE
jgi:hypothetical protein